MTERERQANRNLHTLDEAHRLGRISREEYRARRRSVLGALCDSHGVTARNVITPRPGPSPAGGQSSVRHAASEDVLPTLFQPRHVLAWKHLLMLGAGVVLCALLLYVLLRAG